MLITTPIVKVTFSFFVCFSLFFKTETDLNNVLGITKNALAIKGKKPRIKPNAKPEFSLWLDIPTNSIHIDAIKKSIEPIDIENNAIPYSMNIALVLIP